MLQFVRGGFQQAQSSLNRAKAMGPSRDAAEWLEFVFLRREGRWAESLDRIRDLVASDPSQRVPMLALARTLLWLREYEGAVAAFDRSIALGPSARDAPYLDKAWTLAVAGHSRDSVDAVLAEARAVVGADATLEALILQHPDRGWYWWNDPPDPREFSALRVQLDKRHLPEWYLVASTLSRRSGHLAASREYADSAIVTLTAAWNLGRSPQIAGYMGIAYALRGRGDQAMAWAGRGLTMRPPDEDAYEGPLALVRLAHAAAIIGRAGDAEATVDSLTSIPSPYSQRLFEQAWRIGEPGWWGSGPRASLTTRNLLGSTLSAPPDP